MKLEPDGETILSPATIMLAAAGSAYDNRIMI
jgi:hypothetical protein